MQKQEPNTLDLYREPLVELLGGECAACNRESGLEIHHIDGDRWNNDPDNLTLLCPDCHLDEHGRGSGGVSRHTLSLSDWVAAELDRRAAEDDSVSNRSEYVRQALVARLREEDAGEWSTPDVDSEGVDLRSEKHTTQGTTQ